MTDQDKITALRDALQFFIDRCDSGLARSNTTYAKFKSVLAMTAEASEGATDSAPKFDEAAFEAMVERGTKVWSKVPDDWLEEHRGNLDSAAPSDERAKFEAWLDSCSYPIEDGELERDSEGDYKDGYYNSMWTAWQARAAMQERVTP